MRIQLAQVNYVYGKNAYLPYSIGLLEAHLRKQKFADFLEINESIFLREDVFELAKKMENVDVLALSCYIWNWEWNMKFAQLAKEKNKNLIIIVGGPQVPRNETFLLNHEYIDFAIDYEGEISFSKLIEKLIENKTDFNVIPGIRFILNNVQIEGPNNSPKNSLEEIASPYLDGIFDELIRKNHHLIFQATQETHRGCPYSCTFCDWGSATMSKVRKFSKHRLLGEFDWFANQKIELLYNADANYGLFEEDIEITQELVKRKVSIGFPKKFRAAFAKNSNSRVFEIASILNENQMSKGVTLSFQSMNGNTLELIKRKNMKLNDFETLITSYRKAKIPTYTEIIIGLPGETEESFKHGLNELLMAGQHDSLNVYHAMILENAEMNKPQYKELHKIETVITPLLLLHGNLSPNDIQEYNEIVVSTKDMPRENWVECTMYAWVIQAFHCMNLTQCISSILQHRFGISYKTFYESLIQFAMCSETEIGKIFRDSKEMANNVSLGRGGFNIQDKRFGQIMWPVEEILFLKIITENYQQMLENFLKHSFDFVPSKEKIEILKYQLITMKVPHKNIEDNNIFTADWHTYVNEVLTNQPSKLKMKLLKITNKSNVEYENMEEYAREMIWYGRKGSTMRDEDLHLEEIQS